MIYNLVNDGSASKPQYYLGQWNSSRLWDDQYSGASTSPQVVPPITNGADPSLYDWNVSIPSLNTMTSPPTIIDTYYNNMIICYNGTYPGVTTSVFGTTSSGSLHIFRYQPQRNKGSNRFDTMVEYS